MRRRAARLTEEQKAERVAQKAAHSATQKECQICERNQCVSARGEMVLHGYTRPGYGFIQGSCFGVGHVDYATGTDALEAYSAQLCAMLVNAEENLTRYVRGEVVHFDTLKQEYDRDAHGHIAYDGRKARMRTFPISWAPGVSDAKKYAAHLAAKYANAVRSVEQLQAELARVERRIVAWVAPA